jgi:putative transposase
LRILAIPGHYAVVPTYRRRLPHIYEIGRPVFVTYRLHGSLPASRTFPPEVVQSGRAFVAMDRLLDSGATGPLYFKQPALADMMVATIQNGATLRHYDLHAFVVMANHVHILITPSMALPTIMKSLKGISARRANELLARTGIAFWAEESYDRLVRHQGEFNRINRYIEENPRRAEIVGDSSGYRWSSGFGAT